MEKKGELFRKDRTKTNMRHHAKKKHSITDSYHAPFLKTRGKEVKHEAQLAPFAKGGERKKVGSASGQGLGKPGLRARKKQRKGRAQTKDRGT